MRHGDLVELRSPSEILATLDSNGCEGGLPFMPEMLAFFGRRFQVAGRLERACDTHAYSGTRRFRDTVVLDDLRCDGSAHEGCAARCRLFWREAWLQPAREEAEPPRAAGDPAYIELEGLVRGATTRKGEGGETIYRCQVTELLRGSEPVRWWSPVSLLREIWCGNVGLCHFARVMTLAVAHQVSKRILRKPLLPAASSGRSPEPQGCPLQPGRRVRVRGRDEIASTLDQSSTNRGLKFDFPEMGRYCGKTGSVLLQVQRFIDEPTGRMVELKSDAYLIDGFTCSGDYSTKRWFCPRAIYAWWREDWLEPLATGDEPD